MSVFEALLIQIAFLLSRRNARGKRISLALILLFSSIATPAQELFIERNDSTAREVERMYLRGLQYLTRAQKPEGNFGDMPYGSEPGVVGLAIVSMLAHGDDPNFGPYAQPIRRGLNYILKNQNPTTGYIGRSMYNHGFSTLALAEAYGMVDDDRLGPALEKAIRLIISSQEKNPQKAWRYSPESSDADTTVSGAQMVALFAARNAGLSVPEEAIQRGIKYFLSCQTPEGGFGYTSNSGPNAPRTAIAVLVFALAKEKDQQYFAKAFEYLKKAPAENSYHHYFLYYGAQAFFHHSPAEWQAWNRKNIQTLAAAQTPEGAWEGQFGPTFTTSASLLSLALNYRYLPIYER